MTLSTTLLETLTARFQDSDVYFDKHHQELTLEVSSKNLHSLCHALRHETIFAFEMLVDICGVDYKTYGCSEWMTETATNKGFDRGIHQEASSENSTWTKERFAVVYHLLSLKHNHRLRLRTFPTVVASSLPTVDSVVDIWPASNWYEREVFDLYGIQFTHHPDLRRLLTDYDFEGHPFRKDFPLIGKKEVRYDKAAQKVIYEPVTSVSERTVIPRVIRDRPVSDHPELEEHTNK